MRIPIWARRSALVAGLMMGSVGAAHAFDLLVNHNAVPTEATGPAGGSFSYVPKVILNELPAATGVKLTQVLPVGVTLTGIDLPTGASCNGPTFPAVITAANKTITCDLPNITEVGEANGVAVSFNVTIPTVNTNWLATASASADQSGVNSANESDQSNQTNIKRNITTTEASDLAIALTASTTAPTQFVPYNYLVNVTNNGPTAVVSGSKVIVTFNVPTGTSASGAGGSNGWTCSPNAGAAGTLLTCTHTGGVANGGSIAALTIPVTPSTAGEISASASVAATTSSNAAIADAVDGNNTKTVKVNVAANNIVDVTITNTVSPSTLDKAKTNNEATFTLTPKRNGGANEPADVKVTGTLPTGVSINGSVTGTGWDCSASLGQDVSCNYTGSNIPNVGGSYNEIKVPVIVDGTSVSGNQVVFPAHVSASNEDPSATGNNEASATITLSNTVNLNISKTALTNPIKTGESFKWQLRVSNPSGGNDVLPTQIITVTDTVPAGMAITTTSVPNWTCSSLPLAADATPRTITCTNSSGLAAGSSSDITLTAVGDFSGSNAHTAYTNQMGLTGVSGRDPITKNTSGTVNVSQNTVDLSITKAANQGTDPSNPVASGDVVTYTLVVKNEDTTNPSTGIKVTDKLENLVIYTDGCTRDANNNCVSGTGPYASTGGLISMSIDGTGNSCSASPGYTTTARSRTVTCDIPTLAAGASATITIQAAHYADGPGNREMTNTASARSTQVQGNVNDDDAKATIYIKPVTDIQVTKVPSPAPAAVGEPITYDLHVHNAGPSKAQEVKLVDTLPDNAYWIPGSLTVGSSGSCTLEQGGLTVDHTAAESEAVMGGTLSCEWTGELNRGSQFAVSYQLRSDPEAEEGDTLENSVTVSTTTEELTLENNKADATVTLKPVELDVLINMEHTNDGMPLDASNVDDKTTEYTIKVTNNGPSYATQLKMTDVFPGTLEIGGVEYPSTAIFSYQGMTALSSSVGGDLMGSVDTLCTQPAVNAMANLAPAAPLQLVCEFPKVAPGETITIQFKMRGESLPEGRTTGTIFHNAKVEIYEQEWLSNGNDTEANNDTEDRTSVRLTADVAELVTDLGLSKTASVNTGDDPLKPGDALAYTLTVTNHGPNASPASVVTDVLPKGLDFVDATAGCAYDETSREVRCTLGALADKADTAIVINTTIADPYNGAAPLVNTACVKAEGDHFPDNDCDSVESPVVPPLKPAPVPVDNPLALLALILGMGWIARRFHMRKHA